MVIQVLNISFLFSFTPLLSRKKSVVLSTVPCWKYENHWDGCRILGDFFKRYRASCSGIWQTLRVKGREPLLQPRFSKEVKAKKRGTYKTFTGREDLPRKRGGSRTGQTEQSKGHQTWPSWLAPWGAASQTGLARGGSHWGEMAVFAPPSCSVIGRGSSQEECDLDLRNWGRAWRIQQLEALGQPHSPQLDS